VGERARVLLAMVLAVDPPALLADEPAASLDIRHRIDCGTGFGGARDRSGSRSSSCTISTLTFRFFDNVIVMDAGRIVAHGRARDIFDDERLDAAFGVRFERLMTTLATVSCGRYDLPPVQRSRKGAQYVILPMAW
jgi:iron complex transport system ATP-binding protein